MSEGKLITLREQILSDITPLVLETAEPGAERFSLLLRLIQAGTADSEVYNKAYENAKAIADSGERLDALMALLDEIDFDVQKEENENELPAEQQPHSNEYPANDTDGLTPTELHN